MNDYIYRSGTAFVWSKELEALLSFFDKNNIEVDIYHAATNDDINISIHTSDGTVMIGNILNLIRSSIIKDSNLTHEVDSLCRKLMDYDHG